MIMIRFSMLPLDVEAGHANGTGNSTVSSPDPSPRAHGISRSPRTGLSWWPMMERYASLANRLILIVSSLVVAVTIAVALTTAPTLSKEVSCSRSHEMSGERYAWESPSATDLDFVLRLADTRKYSYGLKHFVEVDARTDQEGRLRLSNHSTLVSLLSEVDDDSTVNVVLLLHGNRGTYGNFDELAATMYRDWSRQGVLDKTLILALDFYEEPNAFHPSVVEAQAEFTRGLMAGVCTEGKKCVLVGHSMGGVVAAIAVSKSSENIVKNVVSLVTVSTPLKTHPAMLDFGWSRVYREVGAGLDKVAVVSVTGGAADWQVPMEDTMVDGKARLQWAQMPTSDGVFAQGDHIAVMYSYEVLTYQVVPAIARALGWRTGAVVGDNEDLKAWMLSLDRPVRRHVPYDRKVEVDGSRVVEVKPLGLGKIRQVWNKGLIIDTERKSGAMLILRREGSYSRCPSVEVVDFNDKEYFSVEAPEVCDYCMRAGNNSAVVTVGAREMPLTSVHIRGDTWCVSPPISSDVKTILVPPGRGGFVVALSSPTVMKLKSRSAYEQYEMGVQLSGIGDAPYLACLVGGDHEVLSATSSSSGGRALMAPSRPLRARKARVMRGAVDTLVLVSTADDVGDVHVDVSMGYVPTLMRIVLTDWPYLLGSLQALLAFLVFIHFIVDTHITAFPILCYSMLSVVVIPYLTSTPSLVLVAIFALVLHSVAYALLGVSRNVGRKYSVVVDTMRPAVPTKHRVMNSALYVVGYLVLVLVCPGVFGHLAALVIGFGAWRKNPCEEVRLGLLVLLQAFAVRSLQLLYTIAALLSRFVADRPHEMVGVNPLMPGVADRWAVLDGAVTALLPLVLALSMWTVASSDGTVLLCMSTRVNRQVVWQAGGALMVVSMALSLTVGAGGWGLPLYYLTVASQCLLLAYVLMMVLYSSKPPSTLDVYEGTREIPMEISMGGDEQQSRRRVPVGNDDNSSSGEYNKARWGGQRDGRRAKWPYIEVSLSPRSSASTVSSTTGSDVSAAGSSGSGEEEEEEERCSVSPLVKTRRRRLQGRAPQAVVAGPRKDGSSPLGRVRWSRHMSLSPVVHRRR